MDVYIVDVLLILAILLYGYEWMNKHTKQLVLSMIPKWIGLTILIILIIYYLTR